MSGGEVVMVKAAEPQLFEPLLPLASPFPEEPSEEPEETTEPEQPQEQEQEPSVQQPPEETSSGSSVERVWELND